MKKKTTQSLILFFTSLILGIILITNIQLDIEDYEEVSLKSVQNMRKDIENYKQQIIDLNMLIKKAEGEIVKYETAIVEKGDITDVIEDEIDNTQFLAGFKDVQGPGIIVVISDSVAEVEIGDNINDLLVHDLDVQRLVNDLKVAGAEAVSVKGQRVLSTSEIECNGPTIRINGRTYPIPFVIKAIGDPKVLNAAVSAPGTYGFKLRDIYGLEVQTSLSNFLLIPKYDGDIDFQYAKPIKEGE